MNEPLINKNATIAFLPSASAVVLDKSASKAKPTTPVINMVSARNIAIWGDDNLFPQTVLAKAEKTFIPAVIDWKVSAMGSRLVYGIEEIDANGKETFKRVKDPVVDAWLKRSNISRYLIETASDLYWWGNMFPELILSNDRSTITSISAQDAMYCRWERQNPETGLIENCYINANWDSNGTEANSAIVKVIDPYYDPVGALRERKDGFKYIYPLSFPSPGKTYYQLVSWDSVRRNGWLEIASLIPTWKKALMQNQISIKYHIEVPEYYWKWKYKDWDKKSEKDQLACRATEMTEFNNFLTGEDKAGKSVMTTSKFDEVTKTKYPGWSITALDDKIADGKYIEDSQEASAHLLFALGIDGTLIGSTPGKGFGAGSGSDKRVAFNMYLELQQAKEDLILEPLHFIRDYNGWNPEYKFKFKRNAITTLDSGNETTPIINGTV